MLQMPTGQARAALLVDNQGGAGGLAGSDVARRRGQPTTDFVMLRLFCSDHRIRVCDDPIHRSFH